jgi:serine phosphatase RsbU (regulator of sigma subunit)
VLATLHGQFVDEAGAPACAVLRIYQVRPYGRLSAGQRGRLPGAPPEPASPCATLLAAHGETAHRETGRRSGPVLPLADPAAAATAPLVAALAATLERDSGRPDIAVAHVPVAAGSPQVPEQDLVREHGVRSVLGYGGTLPSGEAYVVLMFARVAVPRATADRFPPVALATTLALLERRGAAAAGWRAEALERLLSTQEKRLRDEAQIVETLHEIGLTLSAKVEFEPLVRAATEAAVRVTGARYGTFLSVDARGEPSAAHVAPGGFPLPADSTLPAATLVDGRVVRAGDTAVDPRYGRPGAADGDRPDSVRSYLAVPVLSRQGVTHGALLLGHPDTDVFDGRAERLAVGIAGQAAIALDNTRLYREQRQVAIDLQRFLLPRRLPVVEGLAVATRYLAGAHGTEVGGDWFDVIPLPAGRTALVIGDVTGRGLPAAVVMGKLRAAFRACAVMDLSPPDAMRCINQVLLGLELDQLVTCVYAVHDPAEGTLWLANAGHLPPLVVEPGGKARYLEGRPAYPLGMPMSHVNEMSVPFGPGSRLVLCTDGLLERRDHPLRAALDEMRELVPGLGGDLEAACDTLLAVLSPPDSHDDIALLIVEVLDQAVPEAPETS